LENNKKYFKMKIFNLDCHVSVIADLKQIFNDLGHEVTSWSISGSNWIFNQESAVVDIVNQYTWKDINKKMSDEFYERYKDELSIYDAFVCTYPPSFSLIYEKFKKPIILQIPIRYEVPFQNNISNWNMFNQYLRNGIDCGMIIPVANSEYDKKYFEFFVQRDCELIPNICDYTNSKYNPTKNKFIYSSRLPISFDKNFIIDKTTLGKFEWTDLYSYNGIIIIPYNSSTMSIFEYYTANMPIFCPSLELMLDLYKKYPQYVLSELTWNRLSGMMPGSVIECDITKDPNMYNNLDVMSEWISFSDFYNKEWMPHIIYFDNFEELSMKLARTNLLEVSRNMESFNKTRKQKIYSKWEKILNKINE
jgi:hypothetical protein